MARRAGCDRETSAGDTVAAGHAQLCFTERDGYSQAASLVGGNRIIEGRGLGIEIRHDSRNRILNTTITGITQLDPVLGMPSRRAEDTVRERHAETAWPLRRVLRLTCPHGPRQGSRKECKRRGGENGDCGRAPRATRAPMRSTRSGECSQFDPDRIFRIHQSDSSWDVRLRSPASVSEPRLDKPTRLSREATLPPVDPRVPELEHGGAGPSGDPYGRRH